ncbi:hypothetical protein [Solobacterium moorei]|uniref:hypothetical protein n=1 Tax=Solobacterium moorei TaxID=102148 RepID=UPI0023EFF950|nr:hypothetical protein [Solobacterium moorei]
MKQQKNIKKKRSNLELIYLDGGYYAAKDDGGQWLLLKRTQGLKGPKFIAQRQCGSLNACLEEIYEIRKMQGNEKAAVEIARRMIYPEIQSGK